MERVGDNLETIVRREVAAYHGPAHKATTFYIEDTNQHIFTVLIVPDEDYPIKTSPGIVVMARIIDDTVIIEEDTTDRPLYKELLRNGIPREQIVLHYAGEMLKVAS